MWPEILDLASWAVLGPSWGVTPELTTLYDDFDLLVHPSGAELHRGEGGEGTTACLEIRDPLLLIAFRIKELRH